MTMQAISDWLSSTDASQFIANTAWVVPVVQSIHILAIAIVMASIGMLDLRLVGFIGREHSLHGLARRFFPWIWGALVVLFLTGIVMILSEPARELLNWIFWTKMGLLVFAVAVTLPVRKLLEDHRFRDLAPDKRKLVRLCGGLSLIAWVAIVTCGRWIAYAGGNAV